MQIKDRGAKKAVLLMAHGSPEKIGDIPKYLCNIREGYKPDEHLIKKIQNRFFLAGGSPLNKITREQADALQEILDSKQPGEYDVFYAMKNWQPYIKDVICEIKKQRYTDITGIVLSPHYSRMSIDSYRKAFINALGECGVNGQFIKNWHLQPLFIYTIAEQIKKTLDSFSGPVFTVFTAHSLPQHIRTWSDPYEEQLLESCKAVSSLINISNWDFAYQSAGQARLPWLGPDVKDMIQILSKRGVSQILICPIGFTADNLELLYDIDIEAKSLANKLGIDLRRTPSPNEDPIFIKSLYEIVISRKNRCIFNEELNSMRA